MAGGAARHEMANSMAGALLGYVGRVHGPATVAAVLERAGERRSVDELSEPRGWSSYDQTRALFVAASELLDDPDIGRKAGVELFHQYASTELAELMRSLGSPAALLATYPDAQAKQSTITRSEVLDVGDDHGTLASVTDAAYVRHPLFCGYTIGVLSQIPVIFGLQAAEVVEEECQTRGDGRCLLQIRWDPTAPSHADPTSENEYLRRQVEALTDRFEALESVAQELSSARDVSSMLDTIIRRVGVAVRAPQYLLVVRLPRERQRRVHAIGFDDEETRIVADQVLSADPAAGNGDRLLVEIASPRISFGRLAAFFPPGYRFYPQERDLLLAYAGHAAAALETAAALDEARDRNDTLSALLALGSSLAQVGTRSEVAERLAAALPEITGCDRADVLLWDAGDAVLEPAASVGPHPLDQQSDGPRGLRDPRLPNRMLEMRSIPTLATCMSDPVLKGLLTITALRTAMVVPMSARSQLLGVLVVGSSAEDVEADEGLVERMAGVAALAATALDSAMLLDEVRHQALHDPLTELANARLFEDRVTQALRASRRRGSELAVLFVDIDMFKEVNDTYGHSVGDELLRAIASRLDGATRAEDTVARIGGDEFGILLPELTEAADAEVVAAKIVAAMDQVFRVRSLSLSVGASVGVAMRFGDYETYETLLGRADSAMYQAKARGRRRYYVALEPSVHSYDSPY